MRILEVINRLHYGSSSFIHALKTYDTIQGQLRKKYNSAQKIGY